jgi:anti-anti-sigma regulatory factor
VVTAPDLERAVFVEIAEGRDVLLDLSSVSFIGSIGVEAIVLGARRAASTGLELAVHPVMV